MSGEEIPAFSSEQAKPAAQFVWRVNFSGKRRGKDDRYIYHGSKLVIAESLEKACDKLRASSDWESLLVDQVTKLGEVGIP